MLEECRPYALVSNFVASIREEKIGSKKGSHGARLTGGGGWGGRQKHFVQYLFEIPNKSRRGKRTNKILDMRRWAVAIRYALSLTEGQSGGQSFQNLGKKLQRKIDLTKRFHSLCHFNREVAARGFQVLQINQTRKRHKNTYIIRLNILHHHICLPARSTSFRRETVMI